MRICYPHEPVLHAACDPEVAKVLVKTLEEAVAVAHKARAWRGRELMRDVRVVLHAAGLSLMECCKVSRVPAVDWTA